MSSQRSSTSSIPRDIRTNPAPSPAAILTSSGTNIWLELNGHSTKLSTPPRLVASKMMFRARMKMRAALSPPFTVNASIPVPLGIILVATS